MNKPFSSYQKPSSSPSSSVCVHLKTKYFTKLHDIVKDLKTKPYTRENIRTILKMKKDLLNSKNDIDGRFSDLNMYEVTEYNGEEWLAIKQNLAVPKTVIPLEDSFTLLVDIHYNNSHKGGEKYIESYLHSRNLSMPKMFIRHFLAVCDCKSDTIVCRKEVKLAIIPTGVKLEEFTHLLVYRDNSTEYVLLRPLKFLHNKLDAADVAIELIKIFCDYGSPKVLWYNEKDLIVAKYYLEGIWPFKLPEFKMTKGEDNFKTQIYILSKCFDRYKKDENLPLMLYPQLLQWEINSSESRAKFKKMFCKEYKSETDEPSTIFLKCCTCNENVYQENYCHKCKKTAHIICGMRFTKTNNNEIVFLCETCKKYFNQKDLEDNPE